MLDDVNDQLVGDSAGPKINDAWGIINKENSFIILRMYGCIQTFVDIGPSGLCALHGTKCPLLIVFFGALV